MPHRSRRYLRMAAALALAGGSLLAGGAPAVATANIAISPMLFSRFQGAHQPFTQAQCEQIIFAPCYVPAQLQTAYNEQPLFNSGITGAGQTIVIVDSFGSPTIKADLAVFDATFNLPAPPSFKIIQPAGAVPPFDPTDANGDVGWAGETTLDVEWSHAMAPGANILLVETPVDETEGTAGFPQIVKAENYVINHHLGQVISQSFGATEGTFPSAASIQGLRSAYFNAARNHVTVLAATGDAGATDDSNVAGTLLYTHPAVDWPSTDPLVTAVGGTLLSLLSTGQRTQADRVWNTSTNYGFNNAFFGVPGPLASAGSGGKSAVFARPSYQDGVADVTGNQRGVPDISMSAACDGSVNFYGSFPGEPAGWGLVCGTSEASPLFAGIVALADQVAGHSLGLINPALYALSAAHAPGLVDVTAGNNTVSFLQPTLVTVKGFQAGPGYDLASGVGTVNAALFVPELAQAASGG
ncbi:MAG: S53 family peptidase [Streptosporangiaceae bacterium]